MFCKRHYQVTALIFQKARERAAGNADQLLGVVSVERLFADRFAEDNPSFDRELWGRACEPGASVTRRS